MIDWFALETVGLDGTVEAKIENDGLVRFRGGGTATAPGWGVYFKILDTPAEAVLWNANYFDYTGVPSAGDGNVIMNQTHIYPGAQVGLVGDVVDASQIVYYVNPLPPNEHSLDGVLMGLADALRTIAGLRVYDFPSDRIEPPAAVLSLPETPYDITLGGRSDEWIFPLWLLVAKADDKSSYKEMTSYLEAEGPKSIRAVVEADRKLGGACDTVAITKARPLFATVAGTEFLAVEFTLEVYT